MNNIDIPGTKHITRDIRPAAVNMYWCSRHELPMGYTLAFPTGVDGNPGIYVCPICFSEEVPDAPMAYIDETTKLG